MLDSLLSAFTTGVDALCAQLEITRDSLGDELASDLQKERSQLQRVFSDKAQELEVVAEILQVIRAALNEATPSAPA